MLAGLLELFGALRFRKGANYVGVQPPSSVASSFTYTLPNALPGATSLVEVTTGGVVQYTTSAGHTQNTDTGTTQTSFQLDSGNSGVRIKNNGGALELRNAADNARASILVQDLTVSGTTTTVNSETVTIDDNIIVLNNNVTNGSPTEDGGIQIRRGASTSASLNWDETADVWEAGVVGSERPIARTFRQSFVNGDLTTGAITITHNLAQQYCQATVYDNTGKQILPDEVTASGTNALALDLTSFGTLTSTWNVVVVG